MSTQAIEALTILLEARGCMFQDEPEIPEELSGNFDITLDDARKVIRAFQALRSPKEQPRLSDPGIEAIIGIVDEVSGSIGGARLLTPESDHEKKMAAQALPMLRFFLSKHFRDRGLLPWISVEQIMEVVKDWRENTIWVLEPHQHEDAMENETSGGWCLVSSLRERLSKLLPSPPTPEKQ